MDVKQVEVQTESIDTTVTVKWGEHGHLPLTSGTVVLKYQDVLAHYMGNSSFVGAWKV